MFVWGARPRHVCEELTASEAESRLGGLRLDLGSSKEGVKVGRVDFEDRIVAAAATATLSGYLVVAELIAGRLGAPRARKVFVLVLEATHLD